MLNRMQQLYQSSPGWVRAAYGRVPMQYRLGRHFRETRRLLRRTADWPSHRIRKLQTSMLAEQLAHAERNVPAYQEYRGHLAEDPWRALQQLPIIGKEELQADYEAHLAANRRPGSTYVVTTGGSSGNQLEFLLDNATFGIEWAHIIHLWERVGYRPGARLASLRGADFDRAHDGIWMRDPIYNSLVMSPFQMTPENMDRYLRLIKEWRPHFLWGYPSALAILARHIQETGAKAPRVRAILAGSENVYPDQRQLIEDVFQARFYSWYGQSEKVILAGEDADSTAYGCLPLYGATELLCDDGTPVTEVGEVGELVGTGFMNRTLPFIRYRTGDTARLVDAEAMVIEDVHGHNTQEMLVGKNGTMVSATALNMHSGLFRNVRAFQYYQEREGEAEIRVVPRPGFAEPDARQILDEHQVKVQGELTFRVVPVVSLPATERGKRKRVDQRLQVRL